MNSFIICAIVLTFGVAIAGISQILLKKASQQAYRHWVFQYLNVRVIAGYGLMVASTLCTVYAYRTIPLSMAPAWDALGQIFVAFLSYWLLSEKISRKKRIGLGIIIVGILVFFYDSLH